MKTAVKDEWRLPKFANLLIVVIVNLVVIWVVQYFTLQFLKPSWFVTLVICVAVIPLVTIMGLVDIPIQHAGVPLVFGKRQKRWLLDEGLGWILPFPLMGVEIVDLKENTISIPKDEDEEQNKPLIVPAIRGLPPQEKNKKTEDVQLNEETLKTIKFVQMKARLAIRYRVVHPFLYLSQGEKVVERGLGDLAIKTLRQKGAEMSDIQLIRNKDTFEADIIKEMRTEPKDKSTRKKIAASPLERWGVEVHNVFVPRIIHNDPQMAKEYEAAMRAEQQRNARTIDQQFLADSIKQLKAEGLTAQEALYAIQAQGGQLQRREVIITSAGGESGGTVGDITKAVATYAGLLGEQQKSEKTDKQNTQKGGT